MAVTIFFLQNVIYGHAKQEITTRAVQPMSLSLKNKKKRFLKNVG